MWGSLTLAQLDMIIGGASLSELVSRACRLSYALIINNGVVTREMCNDYKIVLVLCLQCQRVYTETVEI